MVKINQNCRYITINCFPAIFADLGSQTQKGILGIKARLIYKSIKDIYIFAD